MICPKCRAEYRPGFTACADCGVALVEPSQLDSTRGGEHRKFDGAGRERVAEAAEDSTEQEFAATEPGNPNRDPFCSFWKGNDPRVHAELCTVLDEAEIAHKTVFRQDHLFNLANYAAFEIGVPASLYEKAETAIKEAFVLDPDEPSGLNEVRLLPEGREVIRRLPATLSPPENEDLPGPPEPGETTESFEGDATTRIWSGGEEYVDQMLLASLHENDIRVRKESNGGKVFLFVLSRDERRAKEIVREIVEGQAPE